MQERDLEPGQFYLDHDGGVIFIVDRDEKYIHFSQVCFHTCQPTDRVMKIVVGNCGERRFDPWRQPVWARNGEKFIEGVSVV